MLRRLVKTGAAWTLSRTGADRLIGALTGRQRAPLVLGYHRVVERFTDDPERVVPAMCISREVLEQQLDWIGRRFRFVSLDELGAGLDNGGAFDEPVAAVTFDDGYRDVYDIAFPLLKRKGIPAAVFVVTDLVGTAGLQDYDRLYLLLVRAFSVWDSPAIGLGALARDLGLSLSPLETGGGDVLTPYTVLRRLLSGLPQADLRRVIAALEARSEIGQVAQDELAPLSWEMLLEMQGAGMTIGSHTKSHALLTNESSEKILEEATLSRRRLEQRLGVGVRHIAYPDGRFNPAVLDAVSAAGYRFGYTVCQHRDSRYPLLTIPRMFCWEKSHLNIWGRSSSSILSCAVNGVFDIFHGCGGVHTAALLGCGVAHICGLFNSCGGNHLT